MEALAGREIHGFITAADLDIEKLHEDASKRWLRPNEVHAILSNYTLFRIQPQPVHLPPNGSLHLFDRKMLRNFRKDGHNWRKKKDGKTVQEAHEKLKIGNEERIHVYYARNEDDLNFYRRCYWLLDRDLERIVLVHYRQTSEEITNQLPSMPIEPKETFHPAASPVASLNSNNASNHSDMSSSVVEEINSGENNIIYAGFHASPTDESTECQRLTLDELAIGWNDVMEQPSYLDLSAHKNGNATSSNEKMSYQLPDLGNCESILQGISSFVHTDGMLPDSDIVGVKQPGNAHLHMIENQRIDPTLMMGNAISQVVDDQMASLGCNGNINMFNDDTLQTQSSFEKWNYIVEDPPGSREYQQAQHHMLNDLPVTTQSSCQECVFSILDISPAYAYHNEETKIIVVGSFHNLHKNLEGSDILCVFGDKCVTVELIKSGVYRTLALPHVPGMVDLYLTLDGHTPISQVVNFEYRSAVSSLSNSTVTTSEVESAMPKQKDLGILIRLVHMLFTTTNSISVLSSRILPNSMRDAERFSSLTLPSLKNQWKRFLDANKNVESSFSTVNQDLFELILKNKLQEWLLFRVAEGCRAATRDNQGQGVIHLCAMLDYAWAIRLFSLSSLSMDFRDAHGWTPLHWAAYYGREKTVAALLSAGANPSLVTDPTPDFPGGCTPADLASQEGFEGLGAYLAEKGLTAHFHAMTLSGNIASPPPSNSAEVVNSENADSRNLSEQELCLKDSLAAYRNAADAADRIQSAFRERSLKQHIKAAESTPEAESIIAALKIQKAFRNHNRRKMMKAAARIQGSFRTWKARKNFLNMRRQVIKIQAIFRGHLERRQYRKIVWSVGIFEKAVLRWRHKRKGLRGLQKESSENAQQMEEDNCVEEEFYRVSREQAEERVKRSVVRVQAMFRSYQAQQEYRRMKLACKEAKMEYDELGDPIYN